MSITDFGSAYQPPGILVEQVATPIIPVVGIHPTVVALVGPAIGYRSFSEADILHATTATALDNLGINASTIVVTSSTGVPYVLGTDYTITQTAGAQAGNAYQTTTIQRTSGSAITDGQTVFVSYQYTDPSYYQVMRFNDFTALVEQYGQPLNVGSNAILSPLSLAAQIAFTNGASQLVCVATTDPVTASTRTGLSAALTPLLAAYDVNVVVPLTVGMVGNGAAPGDVENVATDLKNHCESASADGNYRIGIIGYGPGVTIAPDVLAATIADERVIEAWPFQMNYYNGYNNQTFAIEGCYLAAAYAGVLSSYPEQMPLTRKAVRGFSGIPGSIFQTMTKSFKNGLSAAGVCVTEVDRQGVLRVRHGVTTSTTGGAATREISLVRQQDTLINLIYDTINQAGLIGTPISPRTVANVKSLVQGALEQAVNAGLIYAWSGLGARQESVDPTVIDVMFAYTPAYPLNYIVIAFSIDTTSGFVNLIGPNTTNTNTNGTGQ